MQLNPEFQGTVFSSFTKVGEGSNGTSYWFDNEQLFSAENGDLSRSSAMFITTLPNCSRRRVLLSVRL